MAMECTFSSPTLRNGKLLIKALLKDGEGGQAADYLPPFDHRPTEKELLAALEVIKPKLLASIAAQKKAEETTLTEDDCKPWDGGTKVLTIS